MTKPPMLDHALGFYCEREDDEAPAGVAFPGESTPARQELAIIVRRVQVMILDEEAAQPDRA